MADEENIGELIFRSHNGDLHAFEEIVVRYRRFVFNVFFAYRINYDDWDDLAQEVWIRFYKTIVNRHDVLAAGPVAYLRRIAVNTSINYLRKRKNLPVAQSDEDLSQIEDKSQMESLNLSQDAREAVEEINQLPDQLRQVMILIDVEGYSYEETAKIVNAPLGSVKSWVSRGRNRIKKMLEGDNRNK